MREKLSLVRLTGYIGLKPKEHPFRILALAIFLSATMSPRDTDPKLMCFSG